MKRNAIIAAGLAALFTVSPPALAAGTLQKIESLTANVTLEGGKATVKFTVSGEASDSDNCGYWVDYGDGTSPDTRIISQKDGLFPRYHEHTFTKAGGYSVRVKGQRVKTTLGCVGEATAFVTVVDAAPAAKGGAAKGTAAAPAASAPACPSGWDLVKGSHNAKTGAYICSVKAPEKKLECPVGTRYFSEGARIGCRK